MKTNISKTFLLKSDLSELNSLRNKVEELLSFLNIIDLNRIVLAIDEIISNIIEHGYKSNPENTIEIYLHIKDENKYYEIIIEIVDNAPYFNPVEYLNPNPDEHAQEGKSRGLGIFLVRSIMDDFSYRKKIPTGNINILKKLIYKNHT